MSEPGEQSYCSPSISNAHGAAQDVKDLIDIVDVHAGRRPAAGGCLDAMTVQVLAPEV